MKIKSWHLALLGFLSVCVCSLPSIARIYVEGYTHSEMGMDLSCYILAIIFVIPAIFLGVEEGAKESVIIRLWLIIAFFLLFWFGAAGMLLIMWIFALYLYPFIIFAFIGCLVYFLSSGRQTAGAVVSILVGVIIAYDIWIGVSSPGSMDFVVIIFSLLSAVFYISAGIYYFLREN